MEDGAPKLSRVAVVGAGWAGCAAAVTLARLGHAVTVFEAAPVAGGRARRVVRFGLALDNGQHLLLGAYRQTLNLLAAVHGGDGEAALARARLAIVGLPGTAVPLSLRVRSGPGAFGLAAGMLAARGLTARERIATLTWFRRLRSRAFRCDAGATVAELVADGPARAAALIWFPLCLAALNTPPERASAQVFANVLRDAFGGGSASDFLVPTTDLSSLFPEPALRFVESRGGRVAMGSRARVALRGALPVVSTSAGEDAFDAAVLAVGPHQLADAVEAHPEFDTAIAAARDLSYEPIATVWLGYGTRTPLPSIARLDDAPGQWLFDRPDVLARTAGGGTTRPLAQLVGVVISAGGPHASLANEALVAACDAQLRRLVPGWPRPVLAQAIVERRATYACVPRRPVAPAQKPHARIALAGDWLDDEYPATLEAAVRSGVAAAFAIDAGG